VLGRPRNVHCYCLCLVKLDNITMDLRELGWSGMDWIDLAEDGDQCIMGLCPCLCC
jgi:hypothetical protein